jgi:chromate transporter
MMDEEIVRRRGWLTPERFLDMLGATNLIPGPNSTEMALHIGLERTGWRGLIVAGTCFIAPAFFIVLGCAWAYVRLGALPAAAGLLYGIKPVMIAVVLQAIWGLARVVTKSRAVMVVSSLSFAAAAIGVHELVVLVSAGGALAIWAQRRRVGATPRAAAIALPLGMTAPAVAATGTAAFGLLPLFLFFLKVGSILFGSGYVLLAFLRADLVERWGWLTSSQLLDAVAVGQVTPGPVFTTATFIGYLLAGTKGAVVATVGIFLPSFAFVAASGPLIPRLRRSPTVGAFLDGVNAASVALMALVTAQLARAAVVDRVTLMLAVASAAALIRFRASSAWLIAAGGIIGIALHR